MTTMKRYTVTGGTGHIGAGEVLGLTEAQFATRAPQLDVLEEREGGIRVCRAKSVLQFKAGEEVELANEPPKSMAHILLSPPERQAGRARKSA